MTPCIDLAARFGDHYRLSWEADGQTKAFWPREDWPWLRRVRCRYGVVYPVGGEFLAAFTDRPRIGTQLRALAGVRTARGDVETVAVFHVDDIEPVFALLAPYKRRRLSGADRLKLAERGRRALDAHRKGPGANVDDEVSELGSTRGDQHKETGIGASATHLSEPQALPSVASVRTRRFSGNPEVCAWGSPRPSLEGGLAQGAPDAGLTSGSHPPPAPPTFRAPSAGGAGRARRLSQDRVG
jgi:hypothetical protein